MSYKGNSNLSRSSGKMDDLNTDFLAEMVKRGIDDDFIKKAKEFGKIIRELNTTQIRRIFGQVKKIQLLQEPDKFLPPLLMLKPMLAYTAKRNRQVERLKEVLEAAIDKVCEAKDDKDELKARFQRFCMGFEAIIAYHRAAGGN